MYTTIPFNRIYHTITQPSKCIPLTGMRLLVTVENKRVTSVTDRDGNALRTLPVLLRAFDELCRERLPVCPHRFEVIVATKRITVIDVWQGGGTPNPLPWFDRLMYLHSLNLTSQSVRCVDTTPSDPCTLYGASGPLLVRSFAGPLIEYVISTPRVLYTLAVVGCAMKHNAKARGSGVDAVLLLAGRVDDEILIFACTSMTLATNATIALEPCKYNWAPSKFEFTSIQYFDTIQYMTCEDFKYRGIFLNISKHKLTPTTNQKIDRIPGLKSKSPSDFHLSELEIIVRLMAPAPTDELLLSLLEQIRAHLNSLTHLNMLQAQELVAKYDRHKLEALHVFSSDCWEEERRQQTSPKLATPT